MKAEIYHVSARYYRPVCIIAMLIVGNIGSAADNPGQTLPGHISPLVAASQPIGRVVPNAPVHLALAMRLRDPVGLSDLLQHLYTPGDPQQGQYITPEEFTARFAPTQADYAAVASYASANGLKVDTLHANRMVLDVSGTASQVETAFGVQLLNYQGADGTIFRAPSNNPTLPAPIASRLTAVVGLDTIQIIRPFNVRRKASAQRLKSKAMGPFGATGPAGGYAPSDIKKAYGLNTTPLTGAGQKLALFEMDGYTPSDIAAYEAQFKLPNVPLQNVLVSGATADPNGSGGDSEVELDIELMTALAPGAAKIYVYIGPLAFQSFIDVYNRIAADNLAKQVSTSWGFVEASGPRAVINAENNAFMQMAAQGQSIYAASGDSGAFANGFSVGVDDPSSQPFVTGVGGTSLFTNNAGNIALETTWWDGFGGGGGGGKSTVWSIPDYQAGNLAANSQASATQRNSPDVSLNSDPFTGYSIFYGGEWDVFGGTSCAAPLWAAFTALVNQGRANAAKPPLGFANPLLYQIGAVGNSDFNDISDESTNGFYPAVGGLDNATGWGTIAGIGSAPGTGLLPDLISGTIKIIPNLIVNPGFELGASNKAWVTTNYVVNSDGFEISHKGRWKAWLGGYGKTHTDTLAQTVTVPANITKATLSFWLHIDSQEPSLAVHDKLAVQIRSTSGSVLATLANYSNADAASGFRHPSFDLTAFKGKTIQIYVTETEDRVYATSFVLDDFSLVTQ